MDIINESKIHRGGDDELYRSKAPDDKAEMPPAESAEDEPTGGKHPTGAGKSVPQKNTKGEHYENSIKN